MEIELGELDERKRFEIKLQIVLYETAEKVKQRERVEEFEEYQKERVAKIKEILGYEGKTLRIFENGQLIFEVKE
ncbi:MAG: hypothetical protein J7J42_02170 [Thermoplasmata archaeon]|nr:hypothetical protein [Thermoplasmata archaeon]